MSLYDESVAQRDEIQAMSESIKRLARKIRTEMPIPEPTFRVETIDGVEYRVQRLKSVKARRETNRSADKQYRQDIAEYRQWSIDRNRRNRIYGR